MLMSIVCSVCIISMPYWSRPFQIGYWIRRTSCAIILNGSVVGRRWALHCTKKTWLSKCWSIKFILWELSTIGVRNRWRTSQLWDTFYLFYRLIEKKSDLAPSLFADSANTLIHWATVSELGRFAYKVDSNAWIYLLQLVIASAVKSIKARCLGNSFGWKSFHCKKICAQGG